MLWSHSCVHQALPSKSTMSNIQMDDLRGYMLPRAIQLSFGSPKGAKRARALNSSRNWRYSNRRS
jgi:hypothetical protein